jgi:hypothetical protein
MNSLRFKVLPQIGFDRFVPEDIADCLSYGSVFDTTLDATLATPLAFSVVTEK